MQAVILAAGQGTRMGPLTHTMPKPLLPVADRPLVAHVADAAVAAGADELIFTVGYGGERVREYFGSQYAGVSVTYAEQPQQRGTADALAVASDLLTGDFAVLNGDSLYAAEDLSRLFDSVPQVGGIRVSNPSAYGVLVTDDGVVSEVREKPDDPPSDLVNAGAYTFPADVIDLLDVPASERGERELTDVLDRVVERQELGVAPFDEWMDVGRPWELLEANERRLPGETAGVSATADGGNVRPAGPEGERAEYAGPSGVHPDATVRGDVVIEPGATVGPGAVIDGPVRVRAGASVGPNAYLRGATLIDEDVRVGHAVEIENSVVMSETSIGRLSSVGDSVLGRGVELGAGTDIANRRHDAEPVSLRVKGDSVSTGRRQFGAVLGPGVKTGIQTGINAGVTLSAGVYTDPGEIVTRDR